MSPVSSEAYDPNYNYKEEKARGEAKAITVPKEPWGATDKRTIGLRMPL